MSQMQVKSKLTSEMMLIDIDHQQDDNNDNNCLKMIDEEKRLILINFIYGKYISQDNPRVICYILLFVSLIYLFF